MGTRRNQYIKSVFITSIIFIMYFYVMLKNKIDELLGNIKLYVLSCVLFVIIYSIVFVLYNRKIKSRFIIDYIFLGVLVIGGIAWSIKTYLNEVNLVPGDANGYLRHQLPIYIYIIILVVSYYIINKLLHNQIGSDMRMRIICAVGVAFLQCLLIYSPNVYNDGFGSMYHMHAYTNSIINVLQGIPYSDYNISIYGHYALLFFVPVKILHFWGLSEIQAILCIIALCGFITFYCQYYLMSEFIKNDGVWMLSVLANTVISTQIYKVGQYYQVLPHRILFPAMTLALAWYVSKKRKHKEIMWLICVLSIIWNFEIGIICSCAWTVMDYILSANKKIDLVQMCKELVGFGFSVFLAYGLVCGVNIVMGGKMLTIKQYIYPIGSSVYSIEALELTLPGIYAGYILEIIVFLSAILYVCTKFFIEKIQKEDALVCMIAVMGVGVLTYYMNRAAYCNIAISHIEWMILLGILCDKGMKAQLSFDLVKKPMETITYLIQKSTLFVLVILLLASVSSIGIILPSRIDNAWNMDSVNGLIENIKQDVPKDTFAFGYGVPELYSMLEWQCGLNTIDWSDMNPDNMEYINEKVQDQDCIFANAQAYEQIVNKDDYVCQATYNIAGIQYGYYVKK